MKKSLISIAEAAKRGIERVRDPSWSNPLDHIKIDIVEGEIGPWLHLYAPFNRVCSKRDPVTFMWAIGPLKTDITVPNVVPYEGELPESDTYQNAVKEFERFHSDIEG